jgi:hypothetical protein
MCAGCALAAMAGANGARSWLQARHLTWLTPRRMRLATVALFVAAGLASSLSLSGSSKPPGRLAPQHAFVQAR